MVKRILKRYASLLMIAALVLTTIPIIVFPAFAASTSGTVTGLSDANIGLSFNGEVEDPWTAAGTTITGSATNATTCENNPKKESKLTIKNKSSSVAKLIFKYDVTLNSGSVTIDGTTVTSAGTFSKEIGAGGSIIVDLIAGDKSKATVVTISDIQLILKKTVTATFKAPQHGSYTVNGTQITSDWVNTGSSFDPYTVSATPDSGYIFMGWYNAETMRSISTDASCSLSLNSDCTVMPKFVSNSAALFTAVGRTFDNIDEASEYAADNKQSTVILSKSGTYDKNSTVPSGMTLLIPFDDANTVYTTAPEYVQTEETPVAYRTLTLKSGASITVNGSISVSGKHFTATTAFCNKPTGPYGHIKTEADSKITLNSGANLYAWGYITGDGEVIANSGSKVYEYFQITDWRGGSALSKMEGNKQKVFPFSQYYVQNIEAPLTLKSGADEYTYLSLTAKIIGDKTTTKATTVHFVGHSGAMFNMSAGSEFTKRYIPSQDRISFKTKGNVALQSISLTVSTGVGIGNQTVNSADYVLPINNNVSLEIISGTATISQDLSLQPGVNVTIDEGAEMKVSKGYKLYIYDKAEWSTKYVWTSVNGGIKQIAYTVSSHPTRSLTNTMIDVNGALTAEGNIYTTKSSAEIISSKSTGVYNQVSAPATATNTYQYNQSAETYVEIPVTAAKLKNVNGTFTETASASAGDSIKFVNKEWGGKEPVYVTVTFNPNFSGIAEKTQSVESGVDTKLDTNSFSRTGYTFKGWNTSADGSGTAYANGATVNVSKDTVLYAQWEINTYTVTWKNGDTVLQSGKVAYGTKPAYTGATPTKAATAQYTYTFKGWSPEIVAVTGDTTYTAEFNSVLREYTVTWKNGDTVLQSTKVAYGTKPAYTGATPTKAATAQYTYTFKGWTPEIVAVTGDTTYTAEFNATTNIYKVTWKNGNSVLKINEVRYGEMPTYSGDIPQKTATAQYTYVFKGWSPEVSAVTGDTTYNAVFDAILNEYTIIWKCDDKVLQTDKIAYGETPKFNGTTPQKEATDQYTYVFKGWSPDISEVTGDTTYNALFDTITNKYTVTWKNGDTVLQSGKVAYGTKPTYTGATPTKAATAQYTYVFKGWSPAVSNVTGDATYTAVFDAVVNEYTVTWMNGDTVLQSGKVAYGTKPAYTGDTPTKAATAQYTYVFKGWSPAVSNVTGDATYTAVFDAVVNEYTVTWMNGDTVLATDSLPYGDMPVYSGKTPVKEETSRYTYSFNGWTPEITDVTGNVTYTAVFDENGKNGLCVDGSDTYWIMNGQNVDFPGLIRINVGTDDKPHYHYYYFAEDGKAVKDGIYKVNKNNGLPLPEFNYDFDADGVIVHDEDTSKNGICDGDGSKFYYVDGIKSGVGLIKVGDSYYYARTSTAEIVRNRTYWISNTNDLSIEPGMYHFDDDGRMILNGFISDNYGTYYFVNGTTLKGFAKIGGDYYIFNSYSGKMYKDATMWVGSNDYGIASSLYYFGADGKMSVPDTENGKKSIVEKDGKLYFTIDGAYMTSGLYELDGEYYYVQNNGELAANKTAWVDNKNGLIPEKGNWYAFDESGKLIKTGFVNGSDGYTYYYNNTVLALGFTKIGGDYYLFNSYSGKMYKDATMWVGSNDYGIASSLYYFGADGKMSVPDTENGKKSIVEKDGKLYFTIDGAYMTSGLYELDGEYYYVQNNGELAANKTAWVDNKNGLIPEKGNWYAFDESGKLIKTGFVNGSDGYTYYYNNTVLALGFAKIGGDYYIFNSYSGKMYKDATMWVGSNDYGIASSLYYFGADGKMSVPDTENGKKSIVEKDGKLYFTIDGAYMTSGLYELDGEYYYVQNNGELAANKTVWVDNKNGLIPEKGNWYAFDESGKLIKTCFVNGSDGYTYYYNNTVLALGFTKIGGDYYIFNSYSGKMYKDATMWVGDNGYGIVGGMYYFDKDGKITLTDAE